MKHAAEVVILVDPAQDYDESLTILGVYSTLAAAKAALPRFRHMPYPQCAAAYLWYPDRITEAQRWRGGELVETHTFHPDSGWTLNQPAAVS
ncbi:hypothetical protein [Microbacterium gorillae]|uniref:hypothetical protein n=1 Tax=Microbacterium gorillae TaxID=1231063 RepID=UPI003D951F2A